MAKSSPTTLRLLLLPISTRRSLIYCEPASQHLPADQQTYFDKAVNKAASTWAGWEKSETSLWDWQKRVTKLGNGLLRRVPFEEWGLKSIPSLREHRKLAYEQQPQRMRVEVRYPGQYQGLLKESVLEMCQRLSTERQAFHFRKTWQSVVIMPFTAPVALIPVIPNLPFLYLVFRAYSHSRAYYGSKHLEHLVNNNLLDPKPSTTLDTLYTAGLWHPTREETRTGASPSAAQTKSVVALIRRQMDRALGRITYSSDKKKFESPAATSKKGNNTGDSASNEDKAAPETAGDEGPEEIMLLKGWNGKLLAEQLKLPELEVEIERAVEQVEKDLQKVQKQREEHIVTEKIEKSDDKK